MDRRIRFYADEHVNSCKLSLVAKDFRGWQLTSFRCDQNANIIFHLDIEERIVCIEFVGKPANFLRDVTLQEPCYERTADGYLLRLHHVMPRMLYKTKGIAVYLQMINSMNLWLLLYLIYTYIQSKCLMGIKVEVRLVLYDVKKVCIYYLNSIGAT